MKDLRTVTLADQVFERLESDIIQGVYRRGEMLTELKLVEQLNVSRTPIREALRRLAQERLIADTGYRKASIADASRTAQVVTEHRAIFDAIAAGDADRAAELTTEHTVHAKKSMIERMNNNG